MVGVGVFLTAPTLRSPTPKETYATRGTANHLPMLIYQPHDIRRIDEVIAQRAILASCVRLDSCVPSVEYCLMQVPNI